MTRDVEGAKAFYGKTVGRQFEGMPMEDGTYWVCKDGDQPVGGITGINQARFEGVPDSGSPIWRSMTSTNGSGRRPLQAQS
jgi:uncharacterized protein